MSGWYKLTATANALGAGISTADEIGAVCVQGLVRAVSFDFHGSNAGASLVTTLKTKGDHAIPSYNIIALTNTATNVIKYPTAPATDQVGAAVNYTAGCPVRIPIPVDDHLELTLAGANSGDIVDAYVYLEDPTA
jgi:hypothetical protein